MGNWSRVTHYPLPTKALYLLNKLNLKFYINNKIRGGTPHPKKYIL